MLNKLTNYISAHIISFSGYCLLFLFPKPNNTHELFTFLAFGGFVFYLGTIICAICFLIFEILANDLKQTLAKKFNVQKYTKSIFYKILFIMGFISFWLLPIIRILTLK